MSGFKPSKAYLDRLAQVESGNDPFAQNPNSSAKGRYQFIDSTGEQYGITAPFGTPEYTKQEDEAIARFTADNHKALKKGLGRDPSDDELYLAHQQGAQGALNLLMNPNANAADTVGYDAITLNGGEPVTTSQEFTSEWADTWNSAYREPENDGFDDLPAGFEIDAAPPQGFEIDPPISRPKPEAAPKSGWMRTVLDQFNQGTTGNFSDEIIDPLAALAVTAINDPAALATGDFKDPFLADEIAVSRENSQNRIARQQEDDPLLSLAAQVGGGVASALGTGGAIAAKAPAIAGKISRFAAASPKAAAALAGAGGGAISSAGQAQGNAGDRGDDALWGAGFGAVAGPLASKLGETASGAVKAAAQTRAGKAIIDPIADVLSGRADDPFVSAAAAPPLSPMSAAGIVDEDVLANLEKGRVLPLTKGDRTQDVVTQRMEQTALESGSAPFRAARGQQQAAAYDPFVRVLGDRQILNDPMLALAGQDAISEAAGIVRGKYDDLGRQVNEAYTAAREGGRAVGVSGTAVQNDLINGIEETLSADAYRAGDIPELDARVSELRELIDTNGTAPTPASLNALENWKKRLNATIEDAGFDKKSTARRLGMVGRQYDSFLTNLADDAIVNGDESAIKAFKNARGLAKQKFAFYESDEAISRILDNRDLSNQQLVNIVLGAHKVTGKGENGKITQTMLNLSGDKRPQMQDALKKGVMAKVLQGSLTNTPDPTDLSRNLLSFTNMKKGIGGIMANKDLFETTFDETEQKFMRQMYDDLNLIAGKQQGAVNNSGTGARMADFMVGLGKVINNPLLRVVPGTAAVQGIMEKQAASIVTGKAEKGLEEFLAQEINNLSGKPVFWGYLGGSSTNFNGADPVAGPFTGYEGPPPEYIDLPTMQ